MHSLFIPLSFPWTPAVLFINSFRFCLCCLISLSTQICSSQPIVFVSLPNFVTRLFLQVLYHESVVLFLFLPVEAKTLPLGGNLKGNKYQYLPLILNLVYENNPHHYNWLRYSDTSRRWIGCGIFGKNTWHINPFFRSLYSWRRLCWDFYLRFQQAGSSRYT